ncbi:hypothetical protein [uncultured Cytophaga sp.]|uniref:hypothetical protein n=1 Tax=uncultured Cytophaga sp. TaxID=160238 RepID=UPI002622D4C3|nr:hypothetical protein [uncultured Cytophaga sp.]
MDRRYFNKDGVILAISSIVILLLLFNKSVYDDFVENPADTATKTTSGILFQTVIYFIHVKLGKWAIVSFFAGLTILGIVTGFDWYRFFDKDK